MFPTKSHALLSQKHVNTDEPLRMYLDATFFNTPVHEHIDEPTLKPNCMSEHVKKAENLMRKGTILELYSEKRQEQ